MTPVSLARNFAISQWFSLAVAASERAKLPGRGSMGRDIARMRASERSRQAEAGVAIQHLALALFGLGLMV
jgi:hypothetical protein